ncbi:MAG: AzlC family ABC transporter permease, partial [bacterium]|nr:AzlC family ABC transporter permease [bacterium]
MKARNSFSSLGAILHTSPILVSYLPLGFAYGLMAQGAGLDFFAAALMSVLLYAGSAQYIAVGMIGQNQPVFFIVFTIFIVNLRHILMSSALAPYLSKWSAPKRILFGTQLTDETFALHSTQFP